jgi:signal transduction histidine kinase
VAENADRLATGAPLGSPVVGSDEIAQLDRVLHETGGRLAESAAAEQRARAEIERRAEELAQVNLELAQKTEENELFIYSVSHDLRSPLVNLQGFSKELTRACGDLARQLQGDGVAPELRGSLMPLIEQDIPESVHFIRTAVTRASLIIDALLRLSRAGRVEYRWQLVSVQTVVANVLDAMRAAINERKAEVIVQPLTAAWGDPVAVEQIFANLIGNAVNYLDPRRPGRIEIGMIEPGTYFVRDNGLGIPASGLPKVFVAFQRLHGRLAQGEGIGLALVRRIVDRHHGEIWVDSTEGVGSTFFVRLPASDPGRASSQET